LPRTGACFADAARTASFSCALENEMAKRCDLVIRNPRQKRNKEGVKVDEEQSVSSTEVGSSKQGRARGYAVHPELHRRTEAAGSSVVICARWDLDYQNGGGSYNGFGQAQGFDSSSVTGPR
jgi:hypothetical protein